MRLWHEALIEQLPREQLLGQHRECAALRGRGWGKKHSLVDYVFTYSPYKLYQYHRLIIEEMIIRGYKPDILWLNPCYRGKNEAPYESLPLLKVTSPIYPEHDDRYLKSCIENLKKKDVDI